MENIRNHKDMKLVTSQEKYAKYVMKPNFEDSYPFSKHLIAVEMGETEIRMNKPVYLGQAILDLSKTLMYEFHYDYMRSKYGEKVKLRYMDTDGFIYEIKTEGFYKGIAADVERRFDSSGYSKDDNRPLPIGKNKDELGRKIMTEFVALMAKMYAYRKIDEVVEEKCCNGTNKCVVAEGLAFDDYKTCLFDGQTIYKEQILFRNKRHEIYTVNKKKILRKNEDKKATIRAGYVTMFQLLRGKSDLYY